jgi:hypothetical protein
MVLLPPYFLFAGNVWSYNHQAKASKQGEFFISKKIHFLFEHFQKFFFF